MRNQDGLHAAAFVRQIASLRFDNAFNPYAQVCPEYDRVDAVAIRRRNLELVLGAALRRSVDSLWIARDLGYRGGRRTGLALTDEVHLDMHAALFGNVPLVRATTGAAMAERTAAVIWGSLRTINKPVFLWNVFPLHPFESGDSMSNRCHTREERAACLPLLVALLEMLQPKRVVAIGRDADVALSEMSVEAIGVRHPSYGGQTEFARTIAKLYGVEGPAICELALASLG